MKNPIRQTKSNQQETLVIADLTKLNLPEYSRSILSGERIFQPDIRLKSNDLNAILASRGYIGKVALFDGKYIGNAIGFSPSSEQIEEMGLLGLKENSRNIYLENFVVSPNFQGKGYGTKLLTQFLQECRQKGYESLEGHFRNGSSLHIAEKLGARESQVYPNWQGTGEKYTHCKFKL